MDRTVRGPDMTGWDDLDVALHGPDPDYDVEPTPPEDEESIVRALGRLARIRRRVEQDRTLAEAQIAHTRGWLDERLATHDRAARWHEEMLARYHAARLDRDPRAKTLRYPTGTLRARKAGGGVTVTDEAAFLAWAPDDLVRVTRRPALSAIRKATVPGPDGVAVTADGEPVPGVVLDPERVSFTAATGDDE